MCQHKLHIYQMNLHEYLRIMKIKREDFAKRLGMTRKSLYYLMEGKADPKLSLVRKIIRETNGKVSYEDIIIEEDLD